MKLHIEFDLDTEELDESSDSLIAIAYSVVRPPVTMTASNVLVTIVE